MSSGPIPSGYDFYVVDMVGDQNHLTLILYGGRLLNARSNIVP